MKNKIYIYIINMSYFVADNKINIEQQSVAIPSDNGLSYNPGQLIELKIDPAQVKFFQPQNSYLQFNVKLQMPVETAGAVSKFMLDSHIGAQALIKDIRIHDGSNNALLEEIVGYNIATMLKYDYHCNDSLRNKRALTEGAAKRKFKVYPSAYANAYASKICAGKIKDPSGVKRKDFRGPKPSKAMGGRIQLKKGGKSFPDLSGDGKVTMKDILMGRGVIQRPKKKGGGLMEATSRLRAQGLKMGGIARGCGAVMSDRRKKTKMY